MRALYFECNMGAAGDMLMAALLQLHHAPEDFLRRLNNVGLPNTSITATTAVKCGISGCTISVDINGVQEQHIHEHHHHDHCHYDMQQIENIINALNLSDNIKKSCREVYDIIAQAESIVHGTPVSHVHLHEVGAIDAIADIVGICMLMDELAPNRVLCSPIHTGFGQVHCAHGVIPVPAPATTEILKDIPICGGDIMGELCTPTGAAILKYFVNEFCNMPIMQIASVGYGMGKKDFKRANCVRAFLGECTDTTDQVLELSCNIDDMTPEEVAFAQQLLLEKGALEVFTTPVCMKKGRLGVLFTCLCKPEMCDEIVPLIFLHTSTLGIREKLCNRYVLQRKTEMYDTNFGSVRLKKSYGYGTEKCKIEHDDAAKIAISNNIPLNSLL